MTDQDQLAAVLVIFAIAFLLIGFLAGLFVGAWRERERQGAKSEETKLTDSLWHRPQPDTPWDRKRP